MLGNANSTAEANRNYFENLKAGLNNVYASSHYIVGLKGEIIQCIPEKEQSYCTNQANNYTISIEHCHPDSTGKPNADTYRSLVELCADLCKRYKLQPMEDIIRHYDVTGKMCPMWFVKNPIQWDNFKKDVLIKIKESEKEADEVVDTTKILCNGVIIEVERIFKNDTNYIKLRDLEKIGLKVGYDADRKIPIVTK